MKFISFLTLPAAVIALAASFPLESRAELSFMFNFNDPAGVGFNDATLGATRRNALIQSGLILGSFFLDTNNLTLDVASQNNPGSTTLADASSGFSTAPGFHRSTAQQKAITGIDDNGAAADGNVNWNFGPAWDYDDSVDANAFDFKSTAVHELCHALGFVSLIDQVPTNAPKAYSIFDSFLTDSTGAKLIDPATFQFDTTKSGAITGGISGSIRFDGTQTRQGNTFEPAQPARLFSPNPYQEGSSGSHLDDSFYTTAELLMEAATLPGPGARGFSALEVGMFRDLGYNAIPEPATVGLLVCGVGTLLLRRRRS